jgi:voltage-gated sodium channel
MASAIKKLADSQAFSNLSIGAILLAALSVGLETSANITAQYGKLLHVLDLGLLVFFTAEAAIRFAATAPNYKDYFKDTWNLFDLAIVIACWLPMDTHFAAVLRLVRVLRVIRLIRAFPRLRIIVNALLNGVSSMTYISLLLFILLYIYGVLGVFMFGKTDPDHFGSLPQTFLTLFQIVTLEGWVDVMNKQQEQHPSVGVPLYFISFIVLGTMIILNLFIGTIVGSMSDAQKEEATVTLEIASHGQPSLADEFAALEKHSADLQKRIAALQVRLHEVSTTASKG